MSDHSRKAALAEKNKPHSTREAGAGGSSNTMLRLYTDDNKGLTVVVLLHILGKVARYFTK
ncbi:hypothetical protein MEQU1_000557 [Malassezia equina]|uniref:Uncharacterized protein n=1 Tax=Malassezia equina TaxID=1381935 RepID=A0AAF0EA14_9BASI|nr:hypothetical protein MEQU1_000557 [Malassezia equina]